MQVAKVARNAHLHGQQCLVQPLLGRQHLQVDQVVSVADVLAGTRRGLVAECGGRRYLGRIGRRSQDIRTDHILRESVVHQHVRIQHGHLSPGTLQLRGRVHGIRGDLGSLLWAVGGRQVVLAEALVDQVEQVAGVGHSALREVGQEVRGGVLHPLLGAARTGGGGSAQDLPEGAVRLVVLPLGGTRAELCRGREAGHDVPFAAPDLDRHVGGGGGGRPHCLLVVVQVVQPEAHHLQQQRQVKHIDRVVLDLWLWLVVVVVGQRGQGTGHFHDRQVDARKERPWTAQNELQSDAAGDDVPVGTSQVIVLCPTRQPESVTEREGGRECFLLVCRELNRPGNNVCKWPIDELNCVGRRVECGGN